MELKLNKQQQQEFAQKLNDELAKIFMSWDNEVKEWHGIALEALNYTSSLSLNIPQNKFIELFETINQGISLNIVAVLANNIESRTPFEMARSSREWADILLMNSRICTQWESMVQPIRLKVAKQFQIMAAAPKLEIVQAEA